MNVVKHFQFSFFFTDHTLNTWVMLNTGGILHILETLDTWD